MKVVPQELFQVYRSIEMEDQGAMQKKQTSDNNGVRRLLNSLYERQYRYAEVR